LKLSSSNLKILAISKVMYESESLFICFRIFCLMVTMRLVSYLSGNMINFGFFFFTWKYSLDFTDTLFKSFFKHFHIFFNIFLILWILILNFALLQLDTSELKESLGVSCYWPNFARKIVGFFSILLYFFIS